METCKWCGNEVEREGDVECDFCWELRTHIEAYPLRAQLILNTIMQNSTDEDMKSFFYEHETDWNVE